MKTKLAIIFSLFLLSGCNESKSVDYWKGHIDEARSVKYKCLKDGDDSSNCTNAKQAVDEYDQAHAKKQKYSDSDFPDVKLN